MFSRLVKTKTFWFLASTVVATLAAWQQDGLTAQQALTLLMAEVWGILKRDTDAKAAG
ncbi:MAG: hypothetical protein IH969_09075 [Candidatus Krumholzibacteriota bacterium]|nr:hypothetical protein [Candidatus Krumholzibacteriota bacterium]